MSSFKGFTFQEPAKTSKEDEDKQVSELTFQLSQISAQDEEGSRLASYQAYRSPLSSRSLSETQEMRRLKALELQKQQRNISFSKARQLALGADSPTSDSDEEEEVEGVEEEEEEEEHHDATKRSRDSDDEMEDVTKLMKVKHTAKRKKMRNIYKNQIMYAENMEGIPSDFIENWILMICPKGKRCLVTSGSGETIVRSRAGNIIGRYQTMLPNGSRTNRTSDFCILDCVYDAVHWTFYVLDIMCWRGYPIFDCDTSFRHFWLQTKLEDNELDKPNHNNRFYKFKALKPIPTSETQTVVNNPEAYIARQGFNYDIDGLLFYHRETNYRGGSTPLVCWVPRDHVHNTLSST